jgi:hypothetical protein
LILADDDHRNGSILKIGSDCWLTGKNEIFGTVDQAGAETRTTELLNFIGVGLAKDFQTEPLRARLMAVPSGCVAALP